MTRFVIFGVMMLLVSCSGGVDAPQIGSAADGVSFGEGTWVLEDGTVGGEPITVPDGHRISFTVSDGQAGGTAACNSYSGVIDVDGNDISVGQLTVTEMACDPAVMEAEAAYLDAITEVTTAERNGDILRLEGPEVSMTFALEQPVPTEELVGTTWRLDTLIEVDAASPASGGPATLLLRDDGTFEAGTGCRSLTGRYRISSDSVDVTEMSAEGDCPPELRSQDDHVVTVLGDGFQPSIDDRRLTLTSQGELGLSYTADSGPSSG